MTKDQAEETNVRTLYDTISKKIEQKKAEQRKENKFPTHIKILDSIHNLKMIRQQQWSRLEQPILEKI